MFHRLDVLLQTHRDAEWEELVRAVERKAGHLRAAGFGARVAVPVAVGTGFDAVLSIGSEGALLDDLLPLLVDLPAQFDGTVDPFTSAVITGQVQVVLPGDGSMLSLYPLRPVEGMTHEAFRAHWSEVHAALAREVPGLSGYRQLHGDVEATRAASAVMGVDVADLIGLAEGRRDPDAPALARGPELEAVLADERNFIDVARCEPALYQAISGADSFGG